MYTKLREGTGHDYDFLEAYAILQEFFFSRNLKVNLPAVSPPSVNKQVLLEAVKALITETQRKIEARDSRMHFDSKVDEYRALFSRTPVYQFSDQEYERIQKLISEIRSEIQKATLIPEDHKRRLLRRLEAMQAELHKKTSEIDRFWGFIAEAGIVTRKFGEDLKPLSDRVRELGRIVVCVIMTKEGVQALPDLVKLLEMK
jgi:hypothetical protein